MPRRFLGIEQNNFVTKLYNYWHKLETYELPKFKTFTVAYFISMVAERGYITIKISESVKNVFLWLFK